MAIFTGKIQCMCKKFFKRKMERGRAKWVCQGYDNFSSCQRIAIDEEAMKEFSGRRLFINERTEENILKLIENRIERVEILNKEEFIIHFNNEEPMMRTKQHLHY